MRKLIVLLITLLPIAAFSQKVVNGFGVEYLMGKTYTSTEHMRFAFPDTSKIEVNMTGETKVYGGSLYFPFDMGVKRHRFTLAIGFEYKYSSVGLGTAASVIDNNLIQREGLCLNSTTYTPLVQVLYRPHFYIGRLHTSFSIGANFKYTVFKSLEISDKDNQALVSYKDGENLIDFGGNPAGERMRDLGFHIDPRIGLDFYFNNSFMLSIFALVPDVTNIANTKSIKVQFGAGVTYLIKTNKITEAKILQQYKK